MAQCNSMLLRASYITLNALKSIPSEEQENHAGGWPRHGRLEWVNLARNPAPKKLNKIAKLKRASILFLNLYSKGDYR